MSNEHQRSSPLNSMWLINLFGFFQDGRFSVLARAMEESAYFNKLRAAGSAPITILAPSDEAFQKLPSSRLEAILKDKEARLGNFIQLDYKYITLYILEHIIYARILLDVFGEFG